jgi:hypothetical protein
MTKCLAAVLCGIMFLTIGCANHGGKCCKDKKECTTQKAK